MITGAAQPAGVTPTAPTTTGEIVSSTTRLVIVAPPVFVTIMLYEIGCPGHVPPVTVFVTAIVSSGAGTMNPTPSVNMAVVLNCGTVGAHTFIAVTYAVFVTAVRLQTGPTMPVIVKV